MNKTFSRAAFVASGRWPIVAATLAIAAAAASALADVEQDELPAYTLEKVGEHNGAQSCWIAVEGRVYDVTRFIPAHPTPPAVVLAWCGRDATEGLRTKGYGRDHSPEAWAMLADYLIGRLEE